METFSSLTIDTLGGTTAVARMLDAPVTTVHAWRRNGIPASRLAHLKLAAKDAALAIDWNTGLPPADDASGVEQGADLADSGNSSDLTAAAIGAAA